MRVKLHFGKWSNQRITNILMSGYFLNDYITPTNYFSNHVVSFEHIFFAFDETMVPLLTQWLHCYHNAEALDQ